jgi:hypothetical protein
MAKQTGPIKFEGTIDNLTGYQVNGIHYLKKKSSVSRKRIITDRSYTNTRRNASWFAQAQKLARSVYSELSFLERDHKGVWYPLRNRAQELVRKNLPAEEIIRLLQKEFIEPVKKASKCVRPLAKHLQSKRQLSGQTHSPVVAPPANVDEILNEIFLGRTVNKGLEYKLVDQLAAGYSFLGRLLDKAEQNNVFKTERQALAGTVKKFRR